MAADGQDLSLTVNRLLDLRHPGLQTPALEFRSSTKAWNRNSGVVRCGQGWRELASTSLAAVNVVASISGGSLAFVREILRRDIRLDPPKPLPAHGEAKVLDER